MGSFSSCFSNCVDDKDESDNKEEEAGAVDDDDYYPLDDEIYEDYQLDPLPASLYGGSNINPKTTQPIMINQPSTASSSSSINKGGFFLKYELKDVIGKT